MHSIERPRSLQPFFGIFKLCPRDLIACVYLFPGFSQGEDKLLLFDLVKGFNDGFLFLNISVCADDLRDIIRIALR